MPDESRLQSSLLSSGIPLVGFEPTISAGERPKTYALARAATWTGRGKTSPKKLIADQSSVDVQLI